MTDLRASGRLQLDSVKMPHVRQKMGSAGLALLVALVAAGSAPVATAADSGWSILSLPTPAVAPTGQLVAISCTSATACTAVGVASDHSGLDGALAERWNGASWQGQSTPSMASDSDTLLAGVSCPSASMCTAVGNVLNSSNQHMTLAERWDAGGWHIQSTPNAGGQSDNILSGVSCANATSCTAVGKSTTNFVSSALVEHWDGASWRTQTAAGPAGASGSSLSGVSCSADNACVHGGRQLRRCINQVGWSARGTLGRRCLDS